MPKNNISNGKTIFNQLNLIEKKVKKYSSKLMFTTTIFVNIKKMGRKFLVLYILVEIIFKKLFRRIKIMVKGKCPTCGKNLHPGRGDFCKCKWLKEANLSEKNLGSSSQVQQNLASSCPMNLLTKTNNNQFHSTAYAGSDKFMRQSSSQVQGPQFVVYDQSVMHMSSSYPLMNTAQTNIEQLYPQFVKPNPPSFVIHPASENQEPIIFSNVLVPIKYDFLEIGYGMGFLPTKKIAIIGTPTNDFSINMGEGDMTQTEATLIFFFHTSFAENAVIRGSWTAKNGWGKSERGGGFPFVIGRPFMLEILSVQSYMLQVYVNSKHFISFSCGLNQVRNLQIFGGVNVGSVVFHKQ